MPDRSQFNRLVRFYADDIEVVAVKLGQIMEASEPPYQSLDASAMPVRDVKRRGHGWLAGYADIGWFNSIGWYEGFSLLSVVKPSGVITGFCFAPASTADQPLAKTFFAVRACPTPRVLCAGKAACAPYVADKGFEGAENHRHWIEDYGAEVIHPPKRNPRKSWSKRLKQWIASIRQIVETVYEKLFNTFGLWNERPHELQGLRARLASRVALHNFCMWLNEQLGRPRLKFADLMGLRAHDSHQAFKAVMSVDFRVVQAIERVPEATVGDYRRARLATPNVADVMWRFGAVGEGIHVLGNVSCYLAGLALTVRTRPTDTLMVHKALEVALPGDLVLGDAEGVVVVPREAAGEVSSGTRALEKAEGEIVRSISSGGWERGWIDEKLTEKGCELAD